MNVYDFDGTIYKGDSAIDFYLFCLKRKPIIIKRFISQIVSFIKYKLKKISKEEFKETFYSYFNDIKNIDEYVELFWDKNQHKIKKWYIKQKNKNDVIISASPEFMIKNIGKRLGIKNIICSKVDKKTGTYYGKNCYGEEKVRRFKEIYKDKIINNFYSDNYCDAPLADISENAYYVKNNKIIKWSK